MTRLPAVTAHDYDGGAGIDGSNGKPTLGERMVELYSRATYIGSFADADLPVSADDWEELGHNEGIPAAGQWAFNTDTNAISLWDGTAWRGATGALETSQVARLFTIGPVAAKDTNNVHALYDDANAAFPGPFTNPDVPRNLRVVKSASWDGGTITVVGTDQFDDPQEEVFNDVVETTVGTKIFKTVTGATKSIAAGVAGNGASIGTGDKLGVPADVADTVGVGYVGTTIEAVTVDADEDAVTFTTVPAATTFKALLNIVSA